MYKQSQPGILVSLLKDTVKPIFLLGAGASKQSGVKLVDEIVEEVAKWAYCKNFGYSLDDPRLTMSDWKKWLLEFPWYSEDYSTLYPTIIDELLNPRQSRKDFFLRIINPDVPVSKGYEILAELMHLNLIDTVLTTNFDNCLHNASVQIRRPPFISQIKTSFDLEKLFSYTPRYPQLVYLHGSVEHYTDQNLNDEVKNLNANLVNTIKPLLKDRPLVVIGYRGFEPSIMQGLILDNLNYTNNFHQGIYWCMLKREIDQIGTDKSSITPFVKELASKTNGNFQLVAIDGFDELLSTEVWGKLMSDEIDLKNHFIPKSTSLTQSPTFDTKIIAYDTIGALEIALLRERINNYSERLRIKVYDDQNWLYQQMIRLKVAEITNDDKYELTTSGILLFSSRTQDYIPSAKTVLRFTGSPEWLRQITTFASESEKSVEDFSRGFTERVIGGNMWNQLNEITDALTLINRPFRLKGEISDNVYPYPTLALKEIIVNSLVHRDYSIDEPITIDIFPTHIIFTNPGGLVEDVQRQLDSESMEAEIRKGKRIKGYRNPVLADLFYGSGAMDKEGSGLSDVLKQVMSNSGSVSFGPLENQQHFEVKIFRRPEDVDKLTQTATPIVINQTTRFAGNLLEVLKLPEKVYFADTECRYRMEVYKKVGDSWCPPFLLFKEKIWSFYDMSEWQNPLRHVIDQGTFDYLSVDDFIEDNDGTNEFVRMLNDCFMQHLFSIGLRVDTKKKRAYFTKTLEGTSKEITYQGRLKKATRTVAKPKSNAITGKTYYWEHKSIWFSFEKIGETWFLLINPSYVFTLDGYKVLLKSERVNILSTKKASRDYNMAVHNDLTFWTNYISLGHENAFLLRPNSKAINEGKVLSPILPEIVLSSKLPTITVNDISVVEDFVEPTDLIDIEILEKELEELAREETKNKDE